ncbi:TauD/TfdA dioxygenase family protein [Planomonospora algeriensis]
MSSLTVTPVAGRIGAEISGVRLGGDLPADVVAEIRLALLTHKAVFFRGQDHLDEQGQVAFADDPERAREYAEVFSSTVFETEHPVVRVHPETGERAILLGDFAKRLVGLSSEASASLIRLVQEQVTQVENTVRWRWAPGDVAVWDNRATQHQVVHDFGDRPRRLHRVTVAGDVPVGVDGRPSTVLAGDAAAYSPVAA